MNALVINPKATHIWSYVRQAALQADRMDLLEKIDSKDPKLFINDFKLCCPENLPKPSMDNLYNNKIFLGGNWDPEEEQLLPDCIEDTYQSKEDLSQLDQNNIFR